MHKRSPELVMSASLNRRISRVRHSAMLRIRDEIVMRNGLPPSYPLMGRWFNRHHTSVLDGVRKARLAQERTA